MFCIETVHCRFFAFEWIDFRDIIGQGGVMQDCKCGFDAEPGSLITRREIFLSRYGYFGIRFISATKDFFFAVISTHAGRKPLLIAFLTDFRLDHAAQ